MKILVLTLCICALTIVACKKDEGMDPSSDNLLLSEIRLDNVLLQKLEYNSKNQVTKQWIYDGKSLLGSRIYNYNEKNLPVRVFDEIVSADSFYEDYTYDSNDKLVSGTITSKEGVEWNTSFQYTTNKLIKTSISRDRKNTTTNILSFDDKGNLLKMEHVQNSVSAGTNEWFDYDNKKGAGSSAGDVISMLFSSPNNPTQEKHTFLNQVHEYDLRYTYNDAGYPTVMERYKKGTDQRIDVTHYTYIPANK